MELLQFRFKVYHKPGTAMGHVDGLSRLDTQTVCAVTLSELMEDVSSTEREGFVPVRGSPSSDCDDAHIPLPVMNGEPSKVVAGSLEDALRVAKQPPAEVGEIEPARDENPWSRI
ncbi:hypothetical protein PR001_g13818 [Phytophthora rubi]|uniref:Uncharacterized protein n=1 Tax=Phytophthora rubi TaxID=129364 RepID=A0A6A3LNQ4_9STRA|nr:hypothetical protein PR002_g14078 [Phytophthora rubi]KAE9019657.1 hypothetical protein PR001_g13818 [Phytophthora rubi]